MNEDRFTTETSTDITEIGNGVVVEVWANHATGGMITIADGDDGQIMLDAEMAIEVARTILLRAGYNVLKD